MTTGGDYWVTGDSQEELRLRSLRKAVLGAADLRRALPGSAAVGSIEALGRLPGRRDDDDQVGCSGDFDGLLSGLRAAGEDAGVELLCRSERLAHRREHATSDRGGGRLAGRGFSPAPPLQSPTLRMSIVRSCPLPRRTEINYVGSLITPKPTGGSARPSPG